MTILALEFSAPQRSVAVWRGPGHKPVEVTDTSGARALRPVGMINEALAGAGVGREEIGVVAVGLGPGSYMGIRAAIAVAQGWQLARDVRLVGLSTPEVLAVGLAATGVAGDLSIVVDAQRGEFYLASYQLAGGSARVKVPLRVASRAEVEARAAAGDLLAGPEVTRWFQTGREMAPSAAVLARLAFQRTEFVAGEHLEPIYLREAAFTKAPLTRAIPPLPPA